VDWMSCAARPTLTGDPWTNARPNPKPRGKAAH
jgi:hypothetical protein